MLTDDLGVRSVAFADAGDQSRTLAEADPEEPVNLDHPAGIAGNGGRHGAT
ncbi:MAG: hypothetical protein QM711_03240 [Micropruina sp.]|uniref:hypothetical protein n=1 Tax=Micropruina sp. TaxID=2737536 RepID=UPI0039E6D65D